MHRRVLAVPDRDEPLRVVGGGSAIWQIAGMVGVSDFQLILGDCLEVLRGMADNSVDAVVSDPPYGLRFMGRKWDYDVPSVEVWQEALRVLKPGGHLLSFGGTRTYHRMVVAIEDAGFEIRDTVMWVYGSGFPKSLDVSKAIDKAAGAERDYIGESQWANRTPNGCTGIRGNNFPKDQSLTAPATPAAAQWDGWGTALKPAVEPICMARKPLAEATVAKNVLRWGTGALNIDGARVGIDDGTRCRPPSKPSSTTFAQDNWTQDPANRYPFNPQGAGRFPANLIHDGSAEVLAGFPMTGPAQVRRLNGDEKKPPINAFGDYNRRTEGGVDDAGGSAARFFYVAKSSRSDRNDGLDSTYTVKYNVPYGGTLCKNVIMELAASLARATSGLVALKWLTAESGASIMGLCPRDSLSTTLTAISRITTSEILRLLTPSLINDFTQDVNCETANGGSHAESVGSLSECPPTTTNGSLAESAPGVSRVVSKMLLTISDGANWKPLTNIHSTVKPTALMRYLVRLVTPPGGVVLDPFMGSGSTGKACALEGFGFVGIEIDAEYLAIAEARIAAARAAVQLPMMGIDR